MHVLVGVAHQSSHLISCEAIEERHTADGSTNAEVVCERREHPRLHFNVDNSGLVQLHDMCVCVCVCVCI